MSERKYDVEKPCQLCGSTEKVDMFCGGPVAYMCEGCYELLKKYWDLKDRFDEYHRKRKVEINSQIFFRATFDDDPVDFIWG